MTIFGVPLLRPTKVNLHLQFGGCLDCDQGCEGDYNFPYWVNKNDNCKNGFRTHFSTVLIHSIAITTVQRFTRTVSLCVCISGACKVPIYFTQTQTLDVNTNTCCHGFHSWKRTTQTLRVNVTLPPFSLVIHSLCKGQFPKPKVCRSKLH